MQQAPANVANKQDHSSQPAVKNKIPEMFAHFV
jgi:hypothetical protein